MKPLTPKDENPVSDTFGQFKISDLRTVFDKYCNKDNWKNSFSVTTEDGTEVLMLCAAIEFFFADEPVIRYIKDEKEIKFKFHVITSGYKVW